MERVSWDGYFIKILNEVSSRSTCLKKSVGALVVKDNRILTTGYNGAPSGLVHCVHTGCLRADIESGKNHEICRGVHAEQNAIIQAAKHGISLDGSTLYITMFPCTICAKMIINTGIKKIVYKDEYCDPLAVRLLQEAFIELVRYDIFRDYTGK